MGHRLFDLTDRLALVTASSKGIGFALAEGFAEAGARVVRNGRDETRLSQAVAGSKAKGHDAAPLAFDAADPAGVAAAFARQDVESGAFDILIDNAGMPHRMPL